MWRALLLACRNDMESHLAHVNEDRALFLLQPDPDPDRTEDSRGGAERRTIKSKAEVGFHQRKSEAMREKRKKVKMSFSPLCSLLYVRHQSLKKPPDRVRLETLTMNLQLTK